MGAFVAVDDRFSALIPARELYGEIKVGDVVSARVSAVKRGWQAGFEPAREGIFTDWKDADKLVALMEQHGGALPFTDKADPELIRAETGMSKMSLSGRLAIC